jgi:hypothetical protein
MTFDEFASTENRYFYLLQMNDAEVVSEYDKLLASTVLSHANVETVGDCYLYCASINLMSAYVKQNRLKDYRFKQNIEYFLASIAYYVPGLVRVSIQNDINTSLLVVNISTIQFSFHSVKIPPYLSSIFRDLWDSQDIIMWDEIRKQHCAVSLFHSALNAKQYLSDKTVKGNSLSEILNRRV